VSSILRGSETIIELETGSHKIRFESSIPVNGSISAAESDIMALMNLDKILSWSSLFDKDNLNREVELQNPFSGSVFYDRGSKVAYVLIAPWHAGSYIFTLIKKRIRGAGDAYVQYNLISDILSPDAEATRAYFEIVSQNIRKDLIKIHKESGVEKFIMVGLSLSCVFAMMIASKNELITDVILVAPGSTLAESMWDGLRTAKIKRVMKKEGMTLGRLKKYWLQLAPEEYLEGIKDKKVKIFLSKSDKVIPYRFGKKFADEAKKIIPDVEVKINNMLGHYGTVGSF